jgi:phthiocerol/phenolphthiocerol synthesis type-I polyketide synthase E
LDYRAPQTDAELTLAAILQEVLRIERVGVDDNFFDLGASSLLLAEVHERLQERIGRPLHTSHAFHSAMMEPILPAFSAAVAGARREAPRVPLLSNVTGTWARAEEVTDPAYWARQIRGTVRFADEVGELLRDAGRVLLEVGPGNTLATAARQHPERSGQPVISSLRHPKQTDEDAAFLAGAVGRLWVAGVAVDFAAYHQGERRCRVALPTYPFERRRYWVDPKRPRGEEGRMRREPGEWLQVPVWKQSSRPGTPAGGVAGVAGEKWLLFVDGVGLGWKLAARLEELGAEVATVEPGERYADRPAQLPARPAAGGRPRRPSPGAVG